MLTRVIKKVDELISQSKFDAAISIIDDMEFSDHPLFILREARIALKRGDSVNALKIATSLIERSDTPTYFEYRMIAIRGALHSGALAQVQEHFAEAIKVSNTTQTAVALARLLNNPKLDISYKQKKQYIESLTRKYVESLELFKICNQVFLRQGDFTNSISLWEWWLQKNDMCDSSQLCLAYALYRERRFEECQSKLQGLDTTSQISSAELYTLFTLDSGMGNDRFCRAGIGDEIIANLKLNNAQAGIKISITQYLLDKLLFSEAKKVMLTIVPEKSEQQLSLDKLVAVINAHKIAGEVEKKRIFNNSKHDISCFFKPKTEDVILIFSGMAGKLGITLEKLDEILSAYNASIIYLRDKKKCLYLDGFSSVEEMGLDASVEHLKRLFPSSIKRVHCIGNSAGGFAAIQYGVKFQANSVITFGAITDLTRESLIRDGRTPAFTHRIVGLNHPYAVNLSNTIKELTVCPFINLWYAEGNHNDKRYAENIAVVPQVKLNAIPNTDRHDLIIKLDEEGKLQQVLEDHFCLAFSGT